MTTDDPSRTRRYRLPRRRRLLKPGQFEAVYAARLNRHVGPLAVHVMPNEEDGWRIGLSVPRRVGTAVRRNRIKRRLREVFRLAQHDLPGSYDLVINVRPHEALDVVEYRQLLERAAKELDEAWRRKSRKTSRNP
jgi:ribonuclease P protein component